MRDTFSCAVALALMLTSIQASAGGSLVADFDTPVLQPAQQILYPTT
jgi:hypothetical protein